MVRLMESSLHSHQDDHNKKDSRPGMVIHVYNPSYARGRDKKDHGLRPAQVKMRDPIQKIIKAKNVLGS
jgi:hypothetical protein